MVDTRRGRNRGKRMGNKGGKRHGKVLGDNIQGITNNSKTEINNGQWTVEDEIQYREILEEEDEILQINVNDDMAQGAAEVNKEVKEIKNEDCYELHSGEFFKIDVENEILYNEIIQSQGPIKEVNNEDCYYYLYNEIIQFNESIMMKNEQDRLFVCVDAEDEIDVKIIQDYNKMILEKKLHTSK